MCCGLLKEEQLKLYKTLDYVKTIFLIFLHKGHWFLFICFRSEKIQNLMREGGKKKHLRKKNIQPIFGKVKAA